MDISDSSIEAAVDHEYGIAQQLKGEKHFVDSYAMYKQNGKAFIVQHSLYILNEKIPEELQRIIRRATAYKPDDRYDSMTEMDNALYQFGQTCQTSEPYSTFRFYEEEVAYTCAAPAAAPEDDHSIRIDRSDNWGPEWDDIPNTAPSARLPAGGYHGAGAEKNNGDKAPIPVPPGKLAPGPCFCRVCGASCKSDAKFCAHCGSSLAPLPGVQARRGSGSNGYTSNDDERGHNYVKLNHGQECSITES